VGRLLRNISIIGAPKLVDVFETVPVDLPLMMVQLHPYHTLVAEVYGRLAYFDLLLPMLKDAYVTQRAKKACRVSCSLIVVILGLVR
jgi:hypothetical protein